MPRQRIHHRRGVHRLPDEFPERLSRLQEASGPPDRRFRQPETKLTRQLAFRVTESDYNRIISRVDRSGLSIT